MTNNGSNIPRLCVQSPSRRFLSDDVGKEISRTFSLSSCEADDDDADDEDRNEIVRGDGQFPYVEESMALLGVPDLRVPLEKASTPRSRSGFVLETLIRRDESKTRFVMYHQSASEARPMFCAEIYPDGGKILLKSVPPEPGSTASDAALAASRDPIILGSLTKSRTKKAVVYELVVYDEKNSRSMPIAAIEYDKVSMARSLVEGGRPRYAQVRIAGRPPAETKEPSVQSGGQRVLDFGGRGRETSSKNMQLVAHATGDECSGDRRSERVPVRDRQRGLQGPESSGKSVFRDRGGARGCCLQMVKWNDHEFHVDFGPPFDAIHAFAFALAQFDF